LWQRQGFEERQIEEQHPPEFDMAEHLPEKYVDLLQKKALPIWAR